MSLTSNPTSIRQTFKIAWALYKKHYRLFIASIFVFFASWLLLELIVIAGQRFGFFLWLVAHISFFIVFAGLQIGFLYIGLAIIDRQKPTLSKIFSKLNTGPKAFAAWLLYAIGTLLGLALLILPGTRFGGRYIFYPLFIGEKVSPLQSLKLSANFTKNAQGYIAKFFAFRLLLNIAGASFLGIGLLLTYPLSILMLVAQYRNLQGTPKSA
jgi:uncharacterized membrane protein